MAFRADEAAADRLAEARRYLIPPSFDADQRRKAEAVFDDVVEQVGPAVDAYPTWHPLMAGYQGRNVQTTPNQLSGYAGLDHTRYFAHGFITCPYTDGSEVIASVREIQVNGPAWLSAEILDCTMYFEGTTAVLVRCDWEDGALEDNHMIPKSLAVPLMMQRELPAWRWAEVGETWETMRGYFLGSPHGSRSSLFVSQDTALAMKRVWQAMIESGMYGPIYGRH